MIVKAKSNSHWYYPDGRPCYEVPYAASNKKMAGQMRPTTLKDARELGLLASVTNILSVKAKPGLDAWKGSMYILAALTTPQMVGEDLDAFAERVAEEAESVARSAADFGTRVHNSIENFVVHGEVTEDPEILPYFQNWKRWADANLDLAGITYSEKILIGDGYGGKTDMKTRALMDSDLWRAIIAAGMDPEDYGVIDFKTRRWDPAKKHTIYDEDPAQLAAYLSADAACLGEGEDPASWTASILINSQDSNVAVVAHVYNEKELTRGWELFAACHALWVIDRNYDPRA